MVDLKANYGPIKKEIDEAIMSVVARTNFILGDDVARFEKEFAAYCGAKYAVGVANGTDALKIALMAAGIGEGDEVITTPFTFIATSEAIDKAGGTPVFADIKLDDYNIDPKEIEKKITKKTKAILPVHLYGHPADMDAIMEIARRRGITVIEDCAQSFSARHNNAVTGSIGKAGCFSFFPAKNLGCFGDGGMIITSDEKVYENAKALRNHGQKVKYFTELHGFNSRLDTIQAAVLSVKLKYVDKWTRMRSVVAAKYAAALKDIAVVPAVRKNCAHSFNYYNLMFKNKAERDTAQKQLAEDGIASQIYYPLSLHLQAVYKGLGYKAGDFPVSEKAQDCTLSLPMYPELSDEQIRQITSSVRKAVSG
jgi:dTDP-4-amino-4,6-dideoxygalactose transaminase